MPNATFTWPRRPEVPFLWSDRLRLTHGAIARQARALAEKVPNARRVAIRTAPGILAVAPLIACWTRGVTAVLVDPRERDEECQRIATEVGATLWRPGPPLGIAGEGGEPVELPLDREAVAIRTSGSSGEPKFAVHRLSSLLANARAANARIPFEEGDCWLLSLSPHHVGGLGILLRAMVASSCVHVGGSPGTVVDDLSEHRWITHVSIVATQLRRLLDTPGIDRRMMALRSVLLGGGPTPLAWRREAIERGWPLAVTYGLSECASQVTTSLAISDGDATDAGMPLDGVEVRVDALGEIHVGGPTLFAGYATHDGVRDGPRDVTGRPEFATGDLGRFDERGRLHVLGRRDAMFISGGENIQPEEIENALRTVPGAQSVCVVAIDDPVWVKRPIAFMSGAFDPSQVERALEPLPRFKWPDRILRMPAEEAERSKPRRAALLARLDAETVWTKR